MREQGLVSSYAVAQFKPHSTKCNESQKQNELNRAFHQEEEMTESTGPNKDAALVYRAFSSIKKDLRKIQYFHTDCGNEFKNKLIDEALETFGIKRSLSMKGCPYDNAVTEATFKIIKTEFIKKRHFTSLEELSRELYDYVNWFNYIRIYGTLGYLSPIEYKLKHLKKVV